MSTELFSTLPYKVGVLVIYTRRKIMLLLPLQLQVCPYLLGKARLWLITGGVHCRL